MADVLDFNKPKKEWAISLIKRGQTIRVVVPTGYDDLLCLPADAPFHFLARSADNYIGFCRDEEKWVDAGPFLRTMRTAMEEGLV